MNALSLYVTTCRLVFQAKADDYGAWNDINRLIVYLRQSLVCCVCDHLLCTPMSSTVASCQHHVCKDCIGGKMRLKPLCRCKDYSKFTENVQLRILLQCYKRLCQYMHNSSAASKWNHLQTNNVPGMFLGTGGNTVLTGSGPNTLKDLVEEGSNLIDRFNLSDSSNCKIQTKQGNFSISTPTSLSASLSLLPTTNELNSNIKEMKANGELFDDLIKNGSLRSIGSKEGIEKPQEVTLKSNPQPQTTIIRLATPSLTNVSSQSLISKNSSLSISGISPSSSSSHAAASHLKLKCKMRRGCRCGLATPNPGKLTCCGQRCPCYVEGKACLDCKCRGCRNPNKTEQTGSFTSRNMNTITSHSGASLYLKSPSIQISTVSQNQSSSNRELSGCNILTSSPSSISSSTSSSCNASASVSSTAGQLIRSGIFPNGTTINIISSATPSFSPQLSQTPQATSIVDMITTGNNYNHTVQEPIFAPSAKPDFLIDETHHQTQIIIPAASISVGAEEMVQKENVKDCAVCLI